MVKDQVSVPISKEWNIYKHKSANQVSKFTK